ncbi:MAG: peptide ABC transporter permease [Deltaproteobacteria bacterium]|nr:peptide ABC transporter permease [Deltaproteobacteria bacterium]
MVEKTTPALEFWQRLNRNRLSTVGLLMLGLIFALCLITPWLPLPDPDVTDLANRLKTPLTSNHWLGTDELGRDLLSRLLWGTRVSLVVGFVATLAAALVGSLIGLVAGYFQGWIDSGLMRGVDTLMAFPYMLLALAIVAAFGPGLLNALFAIAIVNVPFFARTVRGATISLVQQEFVLAARIGGASHFGVLGRELLPNILPVIVVTISTTAGWMILETAGLSFLGLGAQPPTADLGSMLGEGRKLLFTAPHVSTLPGLVILILVISLNLLGDGVRDVLDPRLRGGALRSPQPRTEVLSTELSSSQVRSTGKLVVRNLTTELLQQGQAKPLLRNVDFELRPGECLGLVGESGCGKSVTALSLAALAASPPLQITSGTVELDGEDILRLPLRLLQDIRGKRVSYIFQDPLATLNPVLTIGEQLIQVIRRHQSLTSKASCAEALSLLSKVRIPSPETRMKAYPHQLSGGMRQRVCIAIALANRPEVLIADEPTTALDVTIQAEVLSLLNDLRQTTLENSQTVQRTGLSVLFITHDLGVVSTICEKVAVMYAGQIVEFGETQSILESPEHPYTQALLACTLRLGANHKVLGGIPGTPPPPGGYPSGCGFNTRCNSATSICQEPVNLIQLPSGRQVRCVLKQDANA